MQLTTKLQQLLTNPELQNVIEIVSDYIDDFREESLIWEWDSGELLCKKDSEIVKTIVDLERMFNYPEYRITLKSHRGVLSLA